MANPLDPTAPVRARVGIVSWNTAQLLEACLDSLPAALEGLDAEVVVVDNASSDQSAEVAERHPAVTRLIRNPENRGYAKAINQALRAAPLGEGDPEIEPEVLVALNPDTVVPARGLTILVRRLLERPSVGLVVPKLVNTDGSTQHSVYRFPSIAVSAAAGLVPPAVQRGRIANRLWLETGADHDRATDIDWAIGAVHVMLAAAVAGTGGDRYGGGPYNERWFMYVEDLDLCWRLRQGGWDRRLEPEVAVTHVGNAAGAQAWGTGRTARWLSATYDWYRLRNGATATRLWAATNAVGVAAHLATAGLRRVARRPLEPWQRDLPRVLPLHLRALFGSVNSLPQLPPSPHET